MVARTAGGAAGELIDAFVAARAETERLAAPLSPEDQQLQAVAEASPTKWHRAHTTWFWEQFLLAPHGTPPVDRRYAHLFNSYYDAVGERHARPKRGLLSRPSCEAVSLYRRVVDERVVTLLGRLAGDAAALAAARSVVELGIAHEEQHQELILTDILAAFAENPLRPAYAPPVEPPRLSLVGPVGAEGPLDADEDRVLVQGGLAEIGDASAGFAFDCERPRHRVWIEPFAIAGRPITVGDVWAFIEAGGYATPSLWLADGFAWARASGIGAPGHVRIEGDAYVVMTLHGERHARDDEPASHLSYFEADAIARFLGGRLPTEQEWEHAMRTHGETLRPARGFRDAAGGLVPGRVWEWTSSAFAPYPGYRATDGAIAGGLGEYNAKFMHGQMVLRGGSCLTNPTHLRVTTRNFWPATTRLQMSGARVAFDVR